MPRLHDVIQAVMGWTDSHLHRFRTDSDHQSPYLVTTFDLDEGEDGVPEDDVRLDELAGAARNGWRVTGTDLAVATTARAVLP